MLLLHQDLIHLVQIFFVYGVDTEPHRVPDRDDRVVGAGLDVDTGRGCIALFMRPVFFVDYHVDLARAQNRKMVVLVLVCPTT